MNQTAGATNAYRRCSKGGKVREALPRVTGAAGGARALTEECWHGLELKRNVGAELEGRSCVFTQRMLRKNAFLSQTIQNSPWWISARGL